MIPAAAKIAILIDCPDEAARIEHLLEAASIPTLRAGIDDASAAVEQGGVDAAVMCDGAAARATRTLRRLPVVVLCDVEGSTCDTDAADLKNAILIDRAAAPATITSAVALCLRLREEQVRGQSLLEALDRTERRHRDDASMWSDKEVELRDRLNRMLLISEMSSAMVWDWNLETGEIGRNAAAARFGDPNTQPEPVADWWLQNIHPEDRARVEQSFKSLIASEGRLILTDYRFRKGDDYANVSDRGYVIRDEQGKATRIVGMTVDLTELQNAQSELEHTRNELHHVSRLSAMGTMASVLAHELNQPLAAVSNYIHAAGRMVSKNTATPEMLAEILREAGASALRAGEIVRRLREFVAKGSVKKRPEPVDGLVRAACGIALLDAGTLGIRHHVEFAPGTPMVMADKVQIQQVLVNLLRNAVEAVQDRQRREIVVTTVAHDGEIEICVADSGSGVSADQRAELFVPFSTTKPNGMGIGLSLTRTIVEAHGGRIWLAEPEGDGARFCFTLPQAKAEPSKPR